MRLTSIMLGITFVGEMGISSSCRILFYFSIQIDTMTVPSADVSILHRADGSARYSAAGYTVVAAVNGPIEVTRRDELPQHAALEVNVRPAVGVGSEYQSICSRHSPHLI
jgi:hypothetical protein